MRFNAYDGINNAIAQQAKEWERLNAELSESIEAGKEDMIRRQAEANMRRM